MAFLLSLLRDFSSFRLRGVRGIVCDRPPSPTPTSTASASRRFAEEPEQRWQGRWYYAVLRLQVKAHLVEVSETA